MPTWNTGLTGRAKQQNSSCGSTRHGGTFSLAQPHTDILFRICMLRSQALLVKQCFYSQMTNNVVMHHQCTLQGMSNHRQVHCFPDFKKTKIKACKGVAQSSISNTHVALQGTVSLPPCQKPAMDLRQATELPGKWRPTILQSTMGEPW